MNSDFILFRIAAVFVLWKILFVSPESELFNYPYRFTTMNSTSRSLLQTNILFIIFDDLRPELSIYGKKHMITPNFERLAKKSVLFERAYAQVSVCNPSRNSLLTGLRPDTTGIYSFQTGTKPYLIFPTQLARSGYKTSGFGKIQHWDGPDREVWNTDNFEGNWYDYQSVESNRMNSSVMPDKVMPEHEFRDHIFATKAIESLHKFKNSSDYFMIAVGFKMPHLSLHVPYRYYDMYRNKTAIWRRAPDSLRSFPRSAPVIGYRCCAEVNYRFMADEGARRSRHEKSLENINFVVPKRMYTEIMWGYSAAVSFADAQLGRILDAIDELQLWSNLTVVLTSDHGMSNGERGIWEKWNLFEESNHVPLLISHPQSPYAGQRYAMPVELIDIYPTVMDLLVPPYSQQQVYSMRGARHVRQFLALQGESLAPIILGPNYLAGIELADKQVVGSGHASDLGTRTSTTTGTGTGVNSHQKKLKFALSQVWRCAAKVDLTRDPRNESSTDRTALWFDCDINNITTSTELSCMGYSLRSRHMRYTAWIPFDRVAMLPLWKEALYAEELYDLTWSWSKTTAVAMGNTTSARRSMETSGLEVDTLINRVHDPLYHNNLIQHRQQLLSFLRHGVIFRQRNNYKPPTSKTQAKNSSIVSATHIQRPVPIYKINNDQQPKRAIDKPKKKKTSTIILPHTNNVPKHKAQS